MILEVIKKIFNYSIFKDIEYGDVIYAKRYKNKKEYINIPKGHQYGPYIVISKTRRKLYCISGSGSSIKNNEFYYEVNNLYYNLKKNTLFYLLSIKTINKKMYINKIDKLNSEDKNKLTKKILYLKNKNYCKDIKLKNISYKLQVGDIIKVYNKFYIILDITNKIVCFNLRYKNKITINDINYKKISYIEKNASIKYIDSIDNILLNVILKKYQNLLYIKNNRVIPRGSIIEYNQNYYYIYGSIGNELLVIKIRLIFKKKYRKIKLTKKEIYTKFEESKIDKNKEFRLVEILNNKDIDIIKNMRQKYKNNYKISNTKKKEVNNNRIKRGSIIKIRDDDFETFKITNIIDNIIECQSTIDKSSNKLYIDKDKVTLIK